MVYVSGTRKNQCSPVVRRSHAQRERNAGLDSQHGWQAVKIGGERHHQSPVKSLIHCFTESLL